MKKAIFFPGTGYTCREELFLLTGRELEKKAGLLSLLTGQ